MADRKITDLSAQTSLTGTDLMMLVRSGANYKITVANIITSIVADHLADTADAHDASAISVLDTGGNFTGTDVEAVLAELIGGAGGTGWSDDSAATWTRTANQTFTVTGDRTAVFSKGTRLRWTQTTVKYGVVVLSSHAAGTTTVTIATNTDYVLTAAAITLNSYSYQANPQGYPGWFNYTPVWSSSGTQPALVNGTLTGKFGVYGRIVDVKISHTLGSSDTLGTGIYAYSVPITRVDDCSAIAYLNDSGTGEYAAISAGGLTTSNLTIFMNTAAANGVYWTASTPFTPAAGDQAKIFGNYEF